MPAREQVVGNRHIFDTIGVGMQDVARVLVGRCVEEYVDEFAADEKRMAVMAIVFRRDGPEVAGDRPLEGSQSSVSEAGASGGQSTGVIIAESQLCSRTAPRPICSELNCPRSGSGLRTM